MLLPPGARFAPTEEELITHYLNKKISGQPFPQSFVVERELYDMPPWKVFDDQSDPWQTSKVRNKGGSVVGTDRVIYVITKLKKASQSRISRVAGCGVWHGEGGPYKIWDNNNGVIIGTEKTYSFQVPNNLVDGLPEKEGHWIMHELSSTCMGGTETNNNNYVICKISRDDSKPIKRAPPSNSTSRKTTCKKNDKVLSIKRAKPDMTSVEEEEEEDLQQRKKLKRNNQEAEDKQPPTCDASNSHTIEDEYDKYAAELDLELEENEDDDDDNISVSFEMASTDHSIERQPNNNVSPRPQLDNTLGEQAGYFRTEVDQNEFLHEDLDFLGNTDDWISKHPNFSQDLDLDHDLYQGMRNEEAEEEEENNNNNHNASNEDEDEECLHEDFDFSDNADYLISRYRNLFQRMSKDEFDQQIRLQQDQPPVEWTNS